MTKTCSHINKKISFDFDSTLSEKEVQDFVKQHLQGFDVFIVTSRFSDNELEKRSFNRSNKDLFEVANNLGIPKENCIFMNMKDKANFFKKNKDFVFHVDDDKIEIDSIFFLPTKGIFFDPDFDSGWRNEIKKY